MLDRIKAWLGPFFLPENVPSLEELSTRLISGDPNIVRYRKGSPVRCPNGHRICEFVRDIHAGDSFVPEDFVSHVNGNLPGRVGYEAEPCAICDESWADKYV